jgi:hypothetical protein
MATSRGTVVPMLTGGDDVRRRRRRALIFDRMAELRLNQKDLGDRSGLSKSAITRVLKGDRNPQTRTLERLAAALEVPLAHLVDPPAEAGVSRDRSDVSGGTEGAGGGREAILTGGTGRGTSASAAKAPRATTTDESRRAAPAVWYPIYHWGVRVDPRLTAIPPRSTYLERPLPVGVETERIGEDGFGLMLNDASLSNWEGAEGQPLNRGWVVWCNPEVRPGVQDGDLVVASDSARGLIAGVYRQSEEDVYLETDDADLPEQERRRTEPEHVLGPIVMTALFGGVPRRRRRLGAEETSR